MKFLILFFVLISNAQAWTLVSSIRKGFSSTNINVYVATNTCANANLSSSQLESIAKEAMDDYWNGVSASSLELKSAGTLNVDVSADTLTAAVNRISSNTIVIGCSQNATVFTASSILGVGGISCTGDDCRGAILMNDRSGTNLASSSHDTIVMAVAHELGHALGIGHTSVQEALMYYSLTGKSQKSLHQDDIDALTYLYPNKKKLGGLAGSCGTTTDISKGNGGGNNFLFSLIFAFIFSLSLKPFLKNKST